MIKKGGRQRIEKNEWWPCDEDGRSDGRSDGRTEGIEELRKNHKKGGGILRV